MIDAEPVRKLYAAITNSDDVSVRECLGEDVMLGLAGRSRFAGEHHGRDAVVAVLGEMFVLRPKLDDAWDVCVSDHHAVLMDRFEAEREGKSFLGYMAFVCAVEDGRIVRIFPFFEDQYAFDDFFS